MHRHEDLTQIFKECFEKEYQTQLVCGRDEPIYLPATPSQTYHLIVFAHGFFSSALHECAHWFVAGPLRRQHIDYGYWYEPDGRSAEQQALFQKVEVKPQAIEWILSAAAGHRFQFSYDNLNGDNSDASTFKEAVYQQATKYLVQGLPKRAKTFVQALCKFYETGENINLTKNV